MKLCMNSRFWKGRRIFCLILSLMLLCCPIVMAVIVALTVRGTLYRVASNVFLVFGVGQFCFFVFYDMIEGRRYFMDEKGITVTYFRWFKKFYQWNAFESLVVCDFGHASKNPENCFLIIRLAAFFEPDGPHGLNPSRTFWGMERWRGYFYTMRNFNEIIFLGFSPALLEEMQHLSSLPVFYSFTEYGEKIFSRNTADGIWDR